MVKIRLARGGKKKAPFYHIVAADKRRARDGRYIERLGLFNPVAKGDAVRLRLNLERIEYWLGTGAQASDRVQTLIEEHKNGRKEKAPRLSKKAKAREATEAEAAAAEAAKLAEEAAAEAAKPAEEAPAEPEAAAEPAEAEKPADDTATETKS